MIETLAPAKRPDAAAKAADESTPISKAWLWLFGAICLVALALMFRPVVEGDGVGYYSYLHAIFVSHDLSFESEYSAALASHVEVYKPWVTARTESGRLTDYFPVGPAVLSAPAYLVALLIDPRGEPQYGFPFADAFVISSLLYGLIGIALTYRLAAELTRSRRSALIAVIAGVFATPYAFYLLFEPSYAHTFSVFCVSAFLYAWWKGPPKTWPGWLALGVIGGVMGMTRFQDGALMLIVLLDYKRLRWSALAFLPGALLGLAPQAAVDYLQFGTPLMVRAPGQALNLLNGRFLDVLVGSREGLLVWTPVAVLAAVGFFYITDRRLKAAAALAFAAELVILASTPDPPGEAVGPRRFLELLPFAIVGVAAFFQARPRFAAAAVVVACAWNLVLLANFVYLMPPGDPGYARLTTGQLQAIAYAPRLLTKGAVLRNLSGLGGTPLNVVGGLLWLAAEAACVAVAVCLAVYRPMTWARLRLSTRGDRP